MENSPENCNVKVALHIRPLSRLERQNGGVECLDVVPGSAQVLMGPHKFIYDHIYGGGGSPSINMFPECVIPLLDALFQGYNGTVIAYGQTGSGKTYTMGTNPKESSNRGLTFQIMQTIFNKIETQKDESECQLHVSFIEILKEEVKDLLDSAVIERIETSDGNAENAVPGKPPVQVRKTTDGTVNLSGSTEVSVSTQKEMIACLEQGCLKRSVASTDMNSQSSRSHAIFTIILEQKDKNKGDENPIAGEEYRCAKLHLVDLAGAERVKRAGSEGVRLREGIQINKGLLALGNVISALGDDKKRKEAQHIPYRDSKLTRLLQASLGGNCKTVMIACVSPADFNAEETLNTLKYAQRARNIQNKASVQTEVFPADTHKLRQQLRLLQAELDHRREAEIVEVQDLKRKIDWLESTNSELQQKMIEVKDLKRKFDRLEATNTELLQKINEYRNKCAVVGVSETNAQEDKRGSQCVTSQEAITESVATCEIVAKKLKEPDKMTIEQEHEIRQNMSHKDLNYLDKPLEQKELERDDLQAEIARLETMDEPTGREQTMNTEKLEAFEVQISEMERKHEEQIDVLKQRSHDAMKRLQDEISLIKKQKVQLQQKVKEEEEQFRKWKATQEKQMMQIKALKKWLNQELEKVMKVYKLRIDHEKKTQRGRSVSPNARAARIVSLESRMKSCSTSLTILTTQIQEAGRGNDVSSPGRWKALVSLGDAKDLLQYLFSIVIESRRRLWEKELDLKETKNQFEELLSQQNNNNNNNNNNTCDPSWQTTAIQPAKVSSLTKKWKETEEQNVQNTRDKTPSRRSRETEEQGVQNKRDRTPSRKSRETDEQGVQSTRDKTPSRKSRETEEQGVQNRRDKTPSRKSRETEEQAVQSTRDKTPSRKSRETEEQGVQNTRDKTPSRKSSETEKQAATNSSLPPLKGKAPTSLDIFADIGISPPLPFPESKELDSPGICNRPVKVLYKQTEKMIPIAHTSMKKAPLGDQKGKVSRWRRGHDEWLIQFKWKWQKPWKLSEVFGSTDQIRNSDETLKGQDLSTRLSQTT
ncbi:hypothetical protein L2E82_18908 [Cichorium intybus]|uniref:Uncharacterized protein n=1 Tax=Cichorium intybus TaxID=13427 RepID=A0ACB9FAI1_CICIN|nr:hypothetical protein L2E82_18908 [Cichorium intybus]